MNNLEKLIGNLFAQTSAHNGSPCNVYVDVKGHLYKLTGSTTTLRDNVILYSTGKDESENLAQDFDDD